MTRFDNGRRRHADVIDTAGSNSPGAAVPAGIITDILAIAGIDGNVFVAIKDDAVTDFQVLFVKGDNSITGISH